MRSHLITLCFVAVAFVAVAAGNTEGPRVFKVGEELGWRVPFQNETSVYSVWASSNRFHIGDSLLFVYEKEESVKEVDKFGFYQCNGSNPIAEFDDGNSTISLDRPGLFYFISGSNVHCTSGQRLIVEVMHIHQHHRDRGYDDISPSMSPLPSTFPSPSSSSATSVIFPLFLLALTFLSQIIVS